MTLKSQLELISNRAKVFEKLAQSYTEGDYSIKPFELTDIGHAARNEYSKLYKDIKIPNDLMIESDKILKEKSGLGFDSWNKISEEKRTQNAEKLTEYFKRCNNVEIELHKILSDYKDKHPEK